MKTFSLLFFVGAALYGHDNETVHPRISAVAFKSFLESNQGQLPNGHDRDRPLSYVTPNRMKSGMLSNLKASEWFQNGSMQEDAPEDRCVAHFYNPISSAGYYSKPELGDPRFFNLGNRNSFEWATSGIGFNVMGKDVGNNEFTWKNALFYYQLALTAPTLKERDEHLGRTFYSLGHVAHLLQDISQPEHTRNDAHMLNGVETPKIPDWLGFLFPKACWIESYGKKNIDLLLKETDTVISINWKLAKFKKLKDFWDRDFYQGPQDKAALDADAQSFKPGGDPTKLLGLAEFTNGNFLGVDASYIDVVKKNHHKFPFPSLVDTNYREFTNSRIYRASTWRDLSDSDPDGQVSNSGRRSIFLKKSGGGIEVVNHSVLNYTAIARLSIIPISPRGPPAAVPTSVVSINAPSVLEEYHKIALTKAVSYSAGLLDYFFRGRIEANAQSLPSVGDTARCRITVKNTSGADLAFVGGDFKVYVEQNWDESRIPATHASYSSNWSSLSSVLQPDQTVEIECDAPSVSGSSLIVIYQGNIGAKADGTPSDEMDQGKACAITPVTFLP